MRYQRLRVGAWRLVDLIAWPNAPTEEWSTGYLAGIFDAEGSFSQTVLRITNTDRVIIDWITQMSERVFGFCFASSTAPIKIRNRLTS